MLTLTLTRTLGTLCTLAILVLPSVSVLRADQPLCLDSYGDPLPPGALARLGTTRLRHEHAVLSVAFSPDGKWIATGGYDYTVRLWDRATGREARQLRTVLSRLSLNRPARSVHCVGFAPDGRSLAAGFGDGSLRLWEVPTGRALLQLHGHQSDVHALAFSPHGNTLLSGSADQTIRIWDLPTGNELCQLPGSCAIEVLALSPDGALLAAGCVDGSLRIWHLETGQLLRVIEGHQGSVQGLAFSSDARYLASAGQDLIVRLWDLTPALNPLQKPQLWAAIPWGWGPGFPALLQELEFLRLNRPFHQLGGHQGAIKCLTFRPDGKTLLSGSLDGSVRLWEVATGREQSKIEHRLGPVHCFALASDGKSLAVGDGHSVVRLWDLVKGEEIHCVQGPSGPVRRVAFLNEGKEVATASEDPWIRCWNSITGKASRRFVSNSANGTAVAFAANGRVVATGDGEGTIRIWEVLSGEELHHCHAHQGPVVAVALTADGKTVASRGVGETLRLWHVDSATESAVFHGPRGRVGLFTFSPDGKLLACTDGDVTIHLWHTATGKQLRRLVEHGAELDCIAFSPQGDILATGSRDGTIRFWEVSTGKLLVEWNGALGSIQSLAFSPDGRTLAAGSWLTVRLWETNTGRERGRFDGQSGEVVSLAFSPDGRTLAAGNTGTNVLIWDVTGRLREGPLRLASSSSQQLDKLWSDLAGENGVKAFQAIWSLVAMPRQVIPFLESRLHPAPVIDPVQRKRLTQLIADLDREDFAGREQAMLELQKLGEKAESELREALAGQPTNEMRERIGRLLAMFQTPAKVGERLQRLRAIEVLEQIGTSDAQGLLKKLAQGAPEARISQEAKAAWKRLARHHLAEKGTGSFLGR